MVESAIILRLVRRSGFHNRMLKQFASFVLALLRGSTYESEYDSPLRSLRPRWTTFLNILRGLVV